MQTKDNPVIIPAPMSRAQLERLVREDVQRMSEDADLAEWLPEVVADLSAVEVGVWRCRSGEVACSEGQCDDECGCCSDAELWESPLNAPGWEPECPGCGRKALLVEVVGTFDYSWQVAA